jgi:hypothetical protein
MLRVVLSIIRVSFVATVLLRLSSSYYANAEGEAADLATERVAARWL